MNLNWTIAKIEEIAEINPRLGKADIPDNLLVSFVPMPAVGARNGSINVSNVRPYAEVKKGFTSFKEGDVLFAKITPCMENGKMAIVPKVENGYAFGSTEFHVLRPKPGIDARYLYYYVSSRRFRGEAEHQMSGAVGQKRVPTQYLRECTIPLAPATQQTRIVAEIEKQFSRLDEAVANLKRVKANLKRYKAAVLKAAVEGKLTEEWRRGAIHRAQQSDDQGAMNCAPTQPIETGAELLERILAERRKAAGKGNYREPVGPDTSGLPVLPAGWVWVSLGQLIDEPNYGTSKKCDYGAGSVCVLRIPNIAHGVIDADDLKLADFDDEEKRTYALKAGDILTIRSNGSVSLVGKCALVRGQDTKFLYAGYLIRMRPSSADVSSEYLMACLSSQMLRRQIEAKAKSTSGVNNINSGELQSLVVPLCSKMEQHQIVAEVERRLSIVAGAEAQVDANLRRADRLRQSILKQAFSGQLVPQDSNDEPASVLLERIRHGVGAIHESPARAVRKPKRAIHESPLRKPQQTTEPKPAASANFACLDDVTAAILGRMQPGHEYARAELADVLGLTTGRWNAAIHELKRIGKVRQVGEKRGARYVLNGKVPS